jgi:hypothetical protein
MDQASPAFQGRTELDTLSNHVSKKNAGEIKDGKPQTECWSDFRAKANVTSFSVFSRFEVAQGKAAEGLKVQGQKSSRSGACEHSFHLIGSDF